MKNNLKTRNLNRHLFLLITVALAIAMAFLLFSFILNIIMDRNYSDIKNLESNTIKLADFSSIIKNRAGTDFILLPYTGILILIAIPITGLLYAAGYFIYRRNIRFALISAGVLFIIILSLLLGFMLQ